MDNSVDFFEFLGLAIYLGSVAFILGIIFQTFIVVRYNKPWTWGKLTFLLISSRVISLGLTILLWKYWPFDAEPMAGPILIPSIIAEIIVSPLMLRLFKHDIFNKPTTLV